MQNQIATGCCLCEAIHFQAEGKPIWIGHCHCQSCRRNTGSAVATFVGFRPEQLIYTRGEHRFYNSSPGVQRGLCENCGTPLTYEAERFPGEKHLYISTLDELERFVPQFHVFCAEQLP